MKKVFLSLMMIMAPALVWGAPLTPKSIEGAVIVRVDQRDQKMSIAATGKTLASEKDAKKAAQKASFAAVPAGKSNLGELDREAGASSWYCHYSPSYNNNHLYWYGNYYQPYYYYSYRNYSYYYYSSYYNGYNGYDSYPDYDDDYNDYDDSRSRRHRGYRGGY